MKDKKIYRAAYRVLCGNLIASGSTRHVYANLFDDRLVVKVERGNEFPIQNIIEHDVWNDIKDTPAGEWLAPVISMSKCGHVLIQRRTTPVTQADYPKKIPAFLVDTKYQNFGMLDGKFVCHDYGNHNLYQYGAESMKMKKAKWWNE